MTKIQHNFLAVAILLSAFALRVAAIDAIPAGLSHDEAYNGVTAIQTLDGQLRIFYEINKGIEPLIIYLEALAFRAFGIGPVPLRLVNVFAGLLTVALVYPLTARLFNRWVALLAMAGVSISFWAVFVSRLTLRAVLLPPLLLLTLYLFWQALTFSRRSVRLRRQRSAKKSNHGAVPTEPSSESRNPHLFTLLFFALSGFAAGLTMYTYLSSRFVPLIIATVFGYFLLTRQITTRHGWGLLLHVIIWAAVFTPLAAYFVDNQASFSHRADQVTTIPYLLNGEFGPTLRNTARTLGMFTSQGDTTDRYNLDGRPIFDWVNGLIFYVGLALMLWRLTRLPNVAGPAVLLLSSLIFMLLPDFITDDSPHFLRTIGAMPVVYIVWAVGLFTLLQWAGRAVAGFNAQRTKLASFPIRLATPGLLFALLTLTALHTTYDYFVRWANAPEGRSIYGADIAAIARYLKNSDNADLPAISAEYYRDLDPFRFALHFHGEPPFVIWFDGTQTLAFPPAESNLSPRYFFPASAPAAEPWTGLLEPVDRRPADDFTLYRLPPANRLLQHQNDLNRLDVVVNDELRLLGWQLLGDPVGGGQLQLLINWQALRTLPPGTDYTFLARLYDSQGRLWLETDGNGYDPDDWQPGVLALQQLKFHLPGDLPPQAYHLTLSVVDRGQGQALPTATGNPELSLGERFIQLPDQPRPINPDRLPNPMALDAVSRYTAGLALRGFDLDRRRLRPGEEVVATLHWQVLQRPKLNYHLQFFLVDESGGQRYHWSKVKPVSGLWPTGQWPADYWIQDKVTLPATAQTPTGRFQLYVAWDDPGKQSSLDDLLQHSFSLGPVEIEPKG